MTPEQITALATELAKPAYSGKTVAEIAAMLCDEPMVPNPTPKGTRLAPIAMAALLAKIGSGSGAKLAAAAALPAFVAAAKAQDHEAAINWIAIGKQAEMLTQAEFDDLYALLTATVDDDDWQAEVRGPSTLETLTGLRAITGEQITAITGAE